MGHFSAFINFKREAMIDLKILLNYENSYFVLRLFEYIFVQIFNKIYVILIYS